VTSVAAPPQTPKRGPAKKKKGLLNASEYQEALSGQSKVEGIFISARAKHKKGMVLRDLEQLSLQKVFN
jgi:hypothetical protein